MCFASRLWNWLMISWACSNPVQWATYCCGYYFKMTAVLRSCSSSLGFLTGVFKMIQEVTIYISTIMKGKQNGWSLLWQKQESGVIPRNVVCTSLCSTEWQYCSIKKIGRKLVIFCKHIFPLPFPTLPFPPLPYLTKIRVGIEKQISWRKPTPVSPLIIS